MFRPLKLVSLVIILSLLIPAPQAQAKSKAGKYIAAAIVGAVIASAASGSSRRDRYAPQTTYYGGYSPAASYPSYAPQTTYYGSSYAPTSYYSSYAPTGVYYSTNGNYVPTTGYYGTSYVSPYGSAPPADLYRTNSGLGYDRYGYYYYPTDQYSQYYGKSGSSRHRRHCR